MDKVIIDGVDVSECEHYRAEIETKMPYGEYEILKDKCHYSGIEIIQNCKGNKGCIYKQLKRKEQECEVLTRENENRNDWITSLNKKCEELIKEKLNYRTALEDIRRMSQARFVSGLNKEADAYNQDMDLIQAKINEVIGAE